MPWLGCGSEIRKKAASNQIADIAVIAVIADIADIADIAGKQLEPETARRRIGKANTNSSRCSRGEAG